LVSVVVTIEVVGTKTLGVFRVSFPIEFIEFSLEACDFVLVVKEDTGVQIIVRTVKTKVRVACLESCKPREPVGGVFDCVP
jgi:hypothetical protein